MEKGKTLNILVVSMILALANISIVQAQDLSPVVARAVAQAKSAPGKEAAIAAAAAKANPEEAAAIAAAIAKAYPELAASIAEAVAAAVPRRPVKWPPWLQRHFQRKPAR